MWSRNGRTLYYRGNRVMIAATIATRPSLEVTKREPLFPTDTYFSFGDQQYDVFPDEQSFLMLQRDGSVERANAVRMIINWPELLKRRSDAPQ